MARILSWLPAIACVLALAPGSASAAELRCGEWQRLGSAQKDARIAERIGAADRSPEMRQIRIDRGEFRRCLEAETDLIRNSLDDVCAEGLEADLDALEWVFRDYAAACISASEDSAL